MTNEPIDLHKALASFDDLWNPRIAARINDYDVRVTKVAGEYLWHSHQNTDEFFMVLDGELHIALREDGAERVVTLAKDSVFVIPRGIEHKPFSPGGAAIMVIEPAGNPTTGDKHEDIPDHIESHLGRELT